ncbi:hypothetical protein SCP_1501860 [Sparassis crispa]|uniref:DNA-directed DNA polymerase n=1 Tax=Sparassis crispa TaxID=139825 RepID=A0A401H421_9APHY|nr:hypothetical protein SCP_1501860 [Sparassis crispa]GBE89178.1 hypothetical protein SCP_1501860 [Sparassis crispa]
MQVSWCKVEATVSDPKDVNAFSDTDIQFPKETPPLTVMSLGLNTVVNHKENNREIVCATARIWSNLQIDDPTPPEALPCSVHTFVPPLDRFPPNFENEWMLLNSLLDPDVIVGHEFLGVALDDLIHRMRELQGSNLRFINGRLVCDLASDGAKGMISSTTWSLTEMCKTHLKSERQDIDPMILPATSTVACLLLDGAGGQGTDASFDEATDEFGWKLMEQDAQRWTCREKRVYGKMAATVEKIEARDIDAEGGKTTKGKRDKSSNPSEYNIDFMIVDRMEDEEGEEKIPESLSPEVAQGVLPRPIATLVNRRRQAKSLMKDRKATQSQLLQWDIKQMALKLTANSTCGCLGFEYSRFYALPSLPPRRSRVVVYGDTDSVFSPKKAVNGRYKLLEIDLDGIFQRLLLLQEKKYAAIKVEDGGRPSTEVKGLDMKRRGYCALSKAVSQYVPDQILSGEATETVVERIHEYLTTMGEDIRAGKIKLDEFIIPEDHPNAKSQPHV